MLILTRRVGEALRIDSEVAVTILSIQGQQARIGINAPASVEVHREEIFQRIQAERAAEVGQTNSADGVRKVLGQMVAIGDMGVNEARNLIASVDEAHVSQISGSGENVNQHIDERIKEAAAEPVFLTVVFKLPNAQAAGALVNQLPYGQLALGTQARVHGMTTGNLMEDEPCAS